MTGTRAAPIPGISSVTNDVIAWRRHLHADPELSFCEVRTSQFVHDTLAKFGGLELSRPTSTSVVARLIGSTSGPVLALRADMDALPIEERNTHDFVSRNTGVMHACGHDGHTAVMLGVAKTLLARREALHGEVRFIFQHAEELPPGGAEEMVEAGVLDGVDVVLGAHLWSPLEVGKIGVVSGPAMAAPDNFRITIRGSGGHAAKPHDTVDSIAIAAQVVTNLQHIASRNVDPIEPIVVSVTKINGGTTYNVLPGTVELAGTARTFDPKLRERVPLLMERIIRGVTEAHGAGYDFEYVQGYRPVINDAEATEFFRRVAEETFGADALVTLPPTMGGEDFSAFLARRPGTFFFVGARNEQRGIVQPHHHERFDVDEAALPIALRAFVAAAHAYLGSGAEQRRS